MSSTSTPAVSDRLRVALIGATGYTGAELLRLLATHPRVRVTHAVARREVGKPLSHVFPHLVGLEDVVLQAFDPDRVAAEADVAFLALPHATAAQVASPLLDRGLTVLDLSADFRLRDRAVYEAHYGPHPHPELLDGAVYGLVEHNRAVLRGAGREARVTSLLCEAGEGASAYGVAKHRHQPEMEQVLSGVAGRAATVTFVPHLVPMSRGIHASVSLDLVPGAGEAEVAAAFEKAYASERFVRWLGIGRHPHTTHVRGSNRVLVGAAVDARVGRVVVLSVIDNLVKGASGQAVQCLNAVQGWPEALGLGGYPVFP